MDDRAEYVICTDTEGDKQVVVGNCSILGIIICGDGINNPQFALHDGTDNTFPAPFPSTVFKASDLGYKGAMLAFRGEFYRGIFFNHIAGANYQVTVWFLRY